ncbi:MAG TPA: FAD-binding protein [Candidatus Krumholzibacteriaceae bacterium]|nr:FAD-binding protein [Candidatus Krumholzibacteriaceae bacterium]
MPYTSDLKKLIKRVEKTRPERVERKKEGEEFPALSLKEREDILKFHPDFKDEGRSEIKVGSSKGYKISNEIVALLHAESRVPTDLLDLSNPDYEADVLVIGGGGAGTSAALTARENGAKVILATKLRHGDANTMMAEGGIQAATKNTKDSPYYHYLDAMGGGHFTNDPDLVEALVNGAPLVIQWLEKLGAMFSKFDDGRLKTMHGGGTSRKRMHYAGDITGAEIMRTIRDEARSHTDDIKVLEFSPAVELIINKKGICSGAVLYNLETEEYIIVKAKATIMATGGSGRLHMQNFMTTNHYGATADGLIMAYRAGVSLNFLHTVQYHPTGAVFPEQSEGLLITEKFRGAGANIVNIEGKQFVYEREPRDVEASAIIRECVEAGKGVPLPNGKYGVWLDSPMIDIIKGEGTVRKEFPGKWILFKRYDIDITKDPMLVYPTLHYQNGGLEINSRCETSLPGLYAGGEVSGGVHGENRLMGNSLLDVTVFGRIAGEAAAGFADKKYRDAELTLEHVDKYHNELKREGVDTKGRVSPMLLPDYSNPDVRKRQLTTEYLGTIR